MKNKISKVILTGCMLYLGFFMLGPILQFMYFMYQDGSVPNEIKAFLLSLLVFVSIYCTGAWCIASFVTDFFFKDI